VRAIACIDGIFSPLDQARLPVSDRGFLYGDAVFEALRTFRGVPDALDRHLKRLAHSCAILGFEPGVPLSVIADEVERTVSALEGPEAYIRIMLTRGDVPEGLAPNGASLARRVVIGRSLNPPPLEQVGSIDVASCVSPPSPLWAGAKPSAYINNLLAIARAHALEADDALLLGAHGELLEGATSSLFLVDQKERLLTPPVALGILPGITRERVLACAQRVGLDPKERLLTIHDAYRAREVFLTSSVRGLVAVQRVDGLRIGSEPAPGPITRRVFEAYREGLAAP
jgi:branched-chain amino acid aminotransferase